MRIREPKKSMKFRIQGDKNRTPWIIVVNDPVTKTVIAKRESLGCTMTHSGDSKGFTHLELLTLGIEILK